MATKSPRDTPARSGLVGATAVFGVLVLVGIAWMLHEGELDPLGQTLTAWTGGATASGTDGLDAESRALAERGAIAGPAIFPDSNHVRIGANTFRLWGVLTDDVAQLCVANAYHWGCGTRAPTALEQLTSDTNVIACFDRGAASNGERLGQCFRGGVDLGGALIENGLASEVTSETASYHVTQAVAQSYHRGMWLQSP